MQAVRAGPGKNLGSCYSTLNHFLLDCLMIPTLRQFPMTTTSCRLSDVLPALLLATVAFFGVTAMQFTGAFGAGIGALPQVAVVFPPWVDLTEAATRVAGADGRPVRQGRFENIVIAAPNGPGFIDDLYEQGAILVVDPIAFGGCFVSEDDTYAPY